MESLVAALGSSLGGSLLGWIGATVARYQEAKQKKMDQEHELKMASKAYDHELKMLEVAGNQRSAELNALLDTAIVEGEYKGLEASIQADKATYSVDNTNKWLILVDVIRGTMRPLLTATLLLYLMITLAYLFSSNGDDITGEQSYALLTNVITCLTPGANVALAWWFGSRNIARTGG